jgi:hypothetical protein
LPLSRIYPAKNLKPLSFENWAAWGGISAVQRENTVTLERGGYTETAPLAVGKQGCFG